MEQVELENYKEYINLQKKKKKEKRKKEAKSKINCKLINENQCNQFQYANSGELNCNSNDFEPANDISSNYYSMEEHLLSSDQNNEYYDLENHVENLNLDSENEIENTETKKKFIYDTNITTDEFLLTFNSIKQNHHINQNTSNDLIRLINAILPKEIKLKMN